jgi:hypothetical protein
MTPSDILKEYFIRKTSQKSLNDTIYFFGIGCTDLNEKN